MATKITVQQKNFLVKKVKKGEKEMRRTGKPYIISDPFEEAIATLRYLKIRVTIKRILELAQTIRDMRGRANAHIVQQN